MHSVTVVKMPRLVSFGQIMAFDNEGATVNTEMVAIATPMHYATDYDLCGGGGGAVPLWGGPQSYDSDFRRDNNGKPRVKQYTTAATRTMLRAEQARRLMRPSSSRNSFDFRTHDYCLLTSSNPLGLSS